MKFTTAIFSIFIASVVARPYETQTCTSTITSTSTATATTTATGTPDNSIPASNGESTNGGVNPTIHTVVVGGSGKLIYSPAKLVAAKGDIVRFEFMALNHTVTESTFEKPCVSRQGYADFFDTGFVANTGNTMPGPTRDFIVKDGSPRWFYCMQMGHCGKGMVFALNPPSDKMFSEFRYAAMIQNGTAPAGSGQGYGAGAPSGTMSLNYPEPTGYPMPTGSVPTGYPVPSGYPMPTGYPVPSGYPMPGYPVPSGYSMQGYPSPTSADNSSPTSTDNSDQPTYPPTQQPTNPSYSGYQ